MNGGKSSTILTQATDGSAHSLWHIKKFQINKDFFGLEVPFLREYVDHKLIAVTPGIRPVANDDDQNMDTGSKSNLHEYLFYTIKWVRCYGI
jgi:hypothetical protein